MTETDKISYVCHVYDRSQAQPHVGSFSAATRDDVLSAVQDALFEHKAQFTDEQLADAHEAWFAGERHFEFDEDGISLAFFTFARGSLK